MLHFTAPISALPTIVLLFFFAFFTATYLGQVSAYQYIPPDSPIIRGTFSPYAQGFTGYYGEPSDPRRYPVNPGNPLSPDQPLRFTGVNGRQNCPGMIALDVVHCCSAFGYCDMMVLALVVATLGWIAALADQPTIYHILGAVDTLVQKKNVLMIARWWKQLLNGKVQV